MSTGAEGVERNVVCKASPGAGQRSHFYSPELRGLFTDQLTKGRKQGTRRNAELSGFLLDEGPLKPFQRSWKGSRRKGEVRNTRKREADQQGKVAEQMGGDEVQTTFLSCKGGKAGRMDSGAGEADTGQSEVGVTPAEAAVSSVK